MFWQFLTGTEGDMVERGLIMAAIVVTAVSIWFGIGNRLAGKLRQVQAAIQ
jgi:Flp pilus assembly pilin Flp